MTFAHPSRLRGQLPAAFAFLTLLALPLSLPSSARASEIIPLFQERFVEVLSDASTDFALGFETADEIAPGFGSFVSAIDADSEVPGARGDASADQDSEILPTVLSAFGTADASALIDTTNDDFPIGGASAISDFFVEFEAIKTERWVLAGVIDAFSDDDAEAEASVELVGPGGVVLFRMVSDVGLDEFSEFVTLEAGSIYTLQATATADALAVDDIELASGISGYEISLTRVPEPGSFALAVVGALGLWRVGRRP